MLADGTKELKIENTRAMSVKTMKAIVGTMVAVAIGASSLSAAPRAKSKKARSAEPQVALTPSGEKLAKRYEDLLTQSKAKVVSAAPKIDLGEHEAYQRAFAKAEPGMEPKLD